MEIRRICILVLCGLIPFTFLGCRNGVEDLGSENLAINSNIDMVSLVLADTQEIRFDQNRADSPIEKKHYLLKACFVELKLGQSMGHRPVSVVEQNERGRILKGTTNSSGCLFWRQNIDYDITGRNNCRPYQKKISFHQSGDKLTLNYTIDVHNDIVSDLSKSQGCLLQPGEWAYDWQLLDQLEEYSDTSLGLLSSPLSDEDEGGGITAPNPVQEERDKSEPISMKPIEFKYTGEEGPQRSELKFLKYSAEVFTCLHYKYIDAVVADISVDISIVGFRGDAKEVLIEEGNKTDGDGCFTQYFSAKYEQYKYSNWKRNQLQVLLKEGPLAGHTLAQDFYTNPWESDSANIFGIDPRYGKVRENDLPRYNKMQINEIIYAKIGNNIGKFEVNDRLELIISKTYQFIIFPKIDRGYLFNKSSDRYIDLKDGKFKLKFILLAPNRPDIIMDESNYRDFHYISGYEGIVEVKDGIISILADLPIRLADLPRLATRTTSILKLEPYTEKEEHPGLLPSTVRGVFMARRPWIRINAIRSGILNDYSGNSFHRYTADDHERVVDHLRESNQVPDDEALPVEEIISSENKGYREYVENLLDNIPRLIDYTYEVQEDPEEHSSQLLVDNLKESSFPDEEIVIKRMGETKGVEELFERGLANIKEDQELKDLMGIICQSMPVKKRKINRCKRKPWDYFEAGHRFLHASSIDNSWPLYSNGFNINVGSRFFASYDEISKQELSRRTGFDLRLTYDGGKGSSRRPLFSRFGHGVGIRLWDVTYNVSDSNQSKNSIGDYITTLDRITVERFVIRVAGQFERCVLLNGKEAEYLNFYVCSNPFPLTMDEDWYFLQSDLASDTYKILTDPTGPTEIRFIKTLRGMANFEELVLAFNDDTKAYLIEDMSATEHPSQKFYENFARVPVPGEAEEVLATDKVVLEGRAKEAQNPPGVVRVFSLNKDEDRSQGRSIFNRFFSKVKDEGILEQL